MNFNTSVPRVKAGLMAVVIGSSVKHPEILCRQVEVVSRASNDETEIDGWTYDAGEDPSARYWVVKASGSPFYAITDSLYGIVAEHALAPYLDGNADQAVAKKRVSKKAVTPKRETADLC